MKNAIVLTIIVCLLVTANVASADTFGTGENAITIDFVPISGSTNPTSGYGIVANDYRMGTKEITNDQWDKFKAAYGAVTGSPSYQYRFDPYYTGTNVPTNNVSWYEAAQFVNWLNTSTGKPAAYKFTGTIHAIDYTLDVWGAGDADGMNLYRNKAAKYFLPTENEWVKAAYWNGTNIQTYATIGDTVPVAGVYTNYNGIGQPWDVGSGLEELNGTYDMMGNVWEWMESPYTSGDYEVGSMRGLRGGSFYDNDDTLASSNRYYNIGQGPELSGLGFRVASIPEPASLLLLCLGGLALRKRQRANLRRN